MEVPNSEFLKNISLMCIRPQVLHRKGRLPACLQFFWDLFVTDNQKANLSHLEFHVISVLSLKTPLAYVGFSFIRSENIVRPSNFNLCKKPVGKGNEEKAV